MTISEGASLLTFLDAPVMVGDPEGRVIYVNPAFETRFEKGGGDVQGELLASLFTGGAREAVLQAVADVCSGGATARFRVREAGSGFLALVSPIRSEGDSLGVVILLTDEPLADERVLVFHREMQEPLNELRSSLEELLDQTGGRRSEHYRLAVESGLRALERANKWSEALHGILTGRGQSGSANATLDPVRVIQRVAGRLRPELESSGIELELLVPGRLASARGEESRLESALIQLVRQRSEGAQRGEAFSLSARSLGADADAVVIISLVDPPRAGDEANDPENGEPTRLRDEIKALGGRVHTTPDASIGRVTTIALPVAS